MHPHGRYLRFRHVMPELFGPGVQARRGLLRLRWFLLQRIDFRPIWTLGAAAGLGGVLLTVALFFLQGNLRPVIAAREPLRLDPVVAAPPQPEMAHPPIVSTYSQFPPGGMTSPLVAKLQRAYMDYGWDDRRLTMTTSTPQPMEPTLPFSIHRNDLWSRASMRSFPMTDPQAFVPYREPAGLRWNAVTPEVRHSNVAGSASGITPVSRPTAIIEKQMPAAHDGTGPLEYRIIVSNPSANPLPDVSVFEAIDVGRVTAVNPPARVEPNGLAWRLHGLAPGERRELAVTIWTVGLLEVAAATEIELADRVSTVVHVEGQTEEPFFQREPAPANIPAPDLPAFPRQADLPPFPVLNSAPSTPTPAPTIPAFPAFPPTPAPPSGRPLLKLTTEPPAAVAVGEDATTWYEITNLGDAAATDIVLRLTLAEGLLHHDGAREVEFSIPLLAPGAKRRARLVTRAQTHGVYDVSGRLISGDQQETITVQLFAPENDSVAGETEPATDNRKRNPNFCQCTLLVGRTRTDR